MKTLLTSSMRSISAAGKCQGMFLAATRQLSTVLPRALPVLNETQHLWFSFPQTKKQSQPSVISSLSRSVCSIRCTNSGIEISSAAVAVASLVPNDTQLSQPIVFGESFRLTDSARQSLLLPFVANLHHYQHHEKIWNEKSQRRIVPLPTQMPLAIVDPAKMVNCVEYTTATSVARPSPKESTIWIYKEETQLLSQRLSDDFIYSCMNRNARRAKRANHGKLACSRQRRRKRRRRFGNHRR
jgi:hypothetical protein